MHLKFVLYRELLQNHPRSASFPSLAASSSLGPLTDLASETAKENCATIVWEFFQFVGRTHAGDGQQFLIDWVSNILVKTGSDRAGEAIWRHICYCVAAGQAPAPAPLAGPLEQAFRPDKAMTDEVRPRLAVPCVASADGWEQWWTSANPWHNPTETVKATIAANVFAVAWEKAVGCITAESQREITRFARDRARALDLQGVEIDPPGLWAMQYPKTLEGAVRRLDQDPGSGTGGLLVA